jgi:hypothetical protein
MYGLDSPRSAVPSEVGALVQQLVSAPAAKKQKKPSAQLRTEETTNVTANETKAPNGKGSVPEQVASGTRKFCVVFATSQSYVCMHNDIGSKTLSDA